jgi:hypothetical protein
MDKEALLDYLKTIDFLLTCPVELCVYGSGALILLDEPGRTSLDLDVAAPYSSADYGKLEAAAGDAGLPINPPEDHQGEHIEWVGPLRLCLAPPEVAGEVRLWQGKELSVKTVRPAHLVASKLIRYDEADQSDILFLCRSSGLTHADIAGAARQLPEPFANDTIVLENLANLKADLAMWLGEV